MKIFKMIILIIKVIFYFMMGINCLLLICNMIFQPLALIVLAFNIMESDTVMPFILKSMAVCVFNLMFILLFGPLFEFCIGEENEEEEEENVSSGELLCMCEKMVGSLTFIDEELWCEICLEQKEDREYRILERA